MPDFVGYTCWTQADAEYVLPTEALAGNDAAFLATHVPLEGFVVGGSHAAVVKSATEQGLLDAFTLSRKHVFCVIEGEPGSGKSHLIRWLHVRWPKDSGDVVLLVQRKDGSLEGTLNRLRDSIPKKYRSIFGVHQPSQGLADQGKRNNFLSSLANSMEADHFDKDLPDQDWCSKNNIASVLREDKVRKFWNAPGNILDTLCGKGSDGARRDQKLAQFTLRHVVEIGELSRRLNRSAAASGWLRKLRRETEKITKALREGTINDSLESQKRFPESFRFLDALKMRLDNAVHELFGDTAKKLNSRFTDLRLQLKKDRRRLVLLLEDVTAFQGVDQKLLDALIVDADTVQNSLCDLVSIVGVTPDYYDTFIARRGNYQQLVAPPGPVPKPTSLLSEPDAGRRFFVARDKDELAAALDGSLDDWMLFLHPDQRRIVDGIFRGPVQIIGAAGTGKTAVALHRGRELARRGSKVLIATFTRALAQNLAVTLDRLCGELERELITASTLHSQALAIARQREPELTPLEDSRLIEYLAAALKTHDGTLFSVDFVFAEWRGVFEPNGITDWSGWRDVARVGRGTALTVAERHALWLVFKRARQSMWKSKCLDWSGICGVATKALEDDIATSPFQGVLVDEVQDLGRAELCFVNALASGAPEHLMLFGDTGQRIYGRVCNLDSVGIDVSGRIFRLKTNYRTTDTIRRAAETVLGRSSDDGRISRSLLHGPAPVFEGFETVENETQRVASQVEASRAQGLALGDIAILARVSKRLGAIRKSFKAAGTGFQGLLGSSGNKLHLGTLHSAKGLEFRAVVIVGCQEDEMPYRLDGTTDPQDVEDHLNRERHLLYVGMTRAREELLVTWVGERSSMLPVQS